MALVLVEGQDELSRLVGSSPSNTSSINPSQTSSISSSSYPGNAWANNVNMLGIATGLAFAIMTVLV
jgi:hypothetical protein